MLCVCVCPCNKEKQVSQKLDKETRVSSARSFGQPQNTGILLSRMGPTWAVERERRGETGWSTSQSASGGPFPHTVLWNCGNPRRRCQANLIYMCWETPRATTSALKNAPGPSPPSARCGAEPPRDAPPGIALAKQQRIARRSLNSALPLVPRRDTPSPPTSRCSGSLGGGRCQRNRLMVLESKDNMIFYILH